MTDSTFFASTTMDRTPLMYAAEQGDHSNVERLLGFVGSQDAKGRTALMFAAANNHTKCMEWLLEELPMRAKDGLTALDVAIQCKCRDALQVLLAHMQKSKISISVTPRGPHTICNAETHLMRAAKQNDEPTVSRYLDTDCGAEHRGCTALQKAVLFGYNNLVPWLLLESGIRTTGGFTALMGAVQTGNVAAAHMLLHEAGLQAEDGWTALMYASYLKHEECLDILLSEAGLQANNGLTALMLAASSGFVPGVQKLCRLEANKRDAKNYYALMHLALMAPPDTYSQPFSQCADYLLETELCHLASEEKEKLLETAKQRRFHYLVGKLQ